MELVCFHCQKANQVDAKVGFREECQHCKADLHSCKNCHFYDVKVYNQCKEPTADVVKDKEKFNYCEFYQVSSRSGLIDEKEKLKAQAEALFKK
jgi:hypothetical protein